MNRPGAMKTRDKIAIALFAVTLGLGTLVFWQASDNDTEIRRFRWFVAKSPMRLLNDEVLGPENSPSLWYGGVALAAMVMIALVLKALNGAELRAFRDRLVQMEVFKAELETLLQDAVWKEKHAREGKEAAVKDLDASLKRVYDLEDRCGETETLLKAREQDLKALGVTGGTGAGGTRAEREKALREELKRTTELLEAKASEIAQLENSLGGKVSVLESQLGEKERALAALRTQLSEKGAAQSQAERSLQEEIKKGKQALQAKDFAINDIEKRMKGEIQALESQLSEQQSQLRSRSTDLEELKGEVIALTARAADAASAKIQADARRQEIAKKEQVLQAKDSAINKLEERLSLTTRAFEGQLRIKDKLLRDRDAELDALRSQKSALADSGSAKEQTRNLLQQGLNRQTRALREQETAAKELEKTLSAKIQVLETQLREQQQLSGNRGAEQETLKSEMIALTGKLADAAAARERAENLLQQELKKKSELLRSKDSALQEAEKTLHLKVHALQDQLSEKEATLRERDSKLSELQAQMKKLGSGAEEIQRLLAEERKKTAQTLEAKDAAIKGLEKKLTVVAGALEKQAGGQEALVKQRAAQMETLQSEVASLRAQLAEMSSIPERAQAVNAPAKKEQEENLKRLRALDHQLSERGDLLKIRDEKIERLEAELKDKRTELARHEIEEWQSVERRTIWKRRLSKFGIPMKD